MLVLANANAFGQLAGRQKVARGGVQDDTAG
jgi:hypothetical protein